jgi:hypothetical protein
MPFRRLGRGVPPYGVPFIDVSCLPGLFSLLRLSDILILLLSASILPLTDNVDYLLTRKLGSVLMSLAILFYSL